MTSKVILVVVVCSDLLPKCLTFLAIAPMIGSCGMWRIDLHNYFSSFVTKFFLGFLLSQLGSYIAIATRNKIKFTLDGQTHSMTFDYFCWKFSRGWLCWGVLLILFVPNLALHCYCKATYDPPLKMLLQSQIVYLVVLVLCNHLKVVECLSIGKINLGSFNTNYLILEMLKLSILFFSGNKIFCEGKYWIIKNIWFVKMKTPKLINHLINMCWSCQDIYVT